jgi:hypothetical protein
VLWLIDNDMHKTMLTFQFQGGRCVPFDEPSFVAKLDREPGALEHLRAKEHVLYVRSLLYEPGRVLKQDCAQLALAL